MTNVTEGAAGEAPSTWGRRLRLVGGTYTLASYTYWVRERGWREVSWIPTMRTDAAVGYILTGVFMISMPDQPHQALLA